MEFCVEVNAGETKYMFMSHELNAGQNHNIKIANKLFENVTKFKYLGIVVTNEDYRHK
jgi:hypothetical protein